MNKLGFLLLLVCFAFQLEAQHLPLFTQYRHHASVINPAMINTDYLTLENNISIGISHRSQWTSIKNHPTTQTIIGDYINAQGGGVALTAGGYLINDQTGPTGFTGAYGKIGGVLTDDPYYGGLSFGLSFGAVQYRIKTSEIRLRDPFEAIPIEDQTKIFPDFGLGAYFYQRVTFAFLDNDYVYGGISIPQVFGLNLDFNDITGEIGTKRIQHFYAMAGFYKFLKDDYTFIEPSIWLRMAPNAPISVDFNLRYQMSSGFWVGTGASLSGNYHLETGFVVAERLRIGYGFDYSFSSFGGYVGGSHEVNLNFSFPNY